MNSDERMEQMDRKLDAIQAWLLEFRSEVIQRFEHLESRVDLVVDTNRSIDMRLPGLTRAIGELQVRLDKLERPAA